MAAIAAVAALQAFTSYASAYSQSEDIKAQGVYQKSQDEFNSKVADFQGEDAIQRGDKAANQQRKITNETIGAQRASMANQGIDVNSGSAADIQSQTRVMGEQDALTIKNNAWREAWGYKMQALGYKSQGEYAGFAADSKSRNTLLTGGLQAVGYGAQAYTRYNGSKG